METKTCTACKIEKPTTDFRTIRDRGAERLQGKCRDCYNADSRNRYATDDNRRARHIGLVMNTRARKRGTELVDPDLVRDLILAAAECGYCKLPKGQGIPFAVDHIQPVSDGGGNGVDNLIVVCKCCNMAKLGMSEEQFRTWLAGVVERLK